MSTPRVIARVFAVLLIVLFVTVLPVVLLTYNSVSVALSPAFLDPPCRTPGCTKGACPQRPKTWPARCQAGGDARAGDLPARCAGLGADPDRRRPAVERAGMGQGDRGRAPPLAVGERLAPR